jgi:hypothetical protein
MLGPPRLRSLVRNDRRRSRRVGYRWVRMKKLAIPLRSFQWMLSLRNCGHAAGTLSNSTGDQTFLAVLSCCRNFWISARFVVGDGVRDDTEPKMKRRRKEIETLRRRCRSAIHWLKSVDTSGRARGQEPWPTRGLRRPSWREPGSSPGGTYVAPEFIRGSSQTDHTDMLDSVARPDKMPTLPTRQDDESTLLRQRHPHVLVTGGEAAINPVLAQLGPHLRGPISQWRPSVATDPPRVTKGALIIWGVDTLDLQQQGHLLAWMNAAGANVQVVSIAEHPLFPLVCRKAFLDDLYYRLNMVCVSLADQPSDPRVPRA